MKDYKKARRIVFEMCTGWGITAEMLMSGRRTKVLAMFRQAIVKRLRAETKLSWREIGLLCGYKSRAGVSRVSLEKELSPSLLL